MSFLGLASLALVVAIIAVVLLAVLYFLQRRQIRAVERMSRELQRVAVGGKLTERINVSSDQPALAALETAVNHLLGRVATATDRQRQQPALFAELGDRIHEAVLVHREIILYANRQFASLLGVDRADLVGRRLEDLVAPEYSELVADNLAARLAGREAAPRYEIEMVGMQGQLSRLEITTTPIDFEGNNALLITGVEVVETRSMPALVQAAAPASPGNTGALALEAIGEAVVTLDGDGRIAYANPAALKLMNGAASDALGRRIDEALSLADAADRRMVGEPVLQALSQNTAIIGRRAFVVRLGNGAERAVEFSAWPMARDGSTSASGVVLLLKDVTEQRGLVRQMSYQATHDALTGLINRAEFDHRLADAIEAARCNEAHHVLCYLDLDRFKLVNDTSGHLAGDSMLRELAKVMKDCVRDSDTVARVGGDEFAILLVGCPLDKARQIADDVTRKIADYRFVWKDRIFNVGVSIGLVEIGREAGSAEETLSAADSACYVAKKQGAGRVTVYSARDEALARQTGEIQWLQRLQSALRDSRFELNTQQIERVDQLCEDGPAVEVLVRLKDDNGEAIAPLEFVRAAERYRLMGLVDRWVVQTTLSALSRELIALPADRSVAINVSGQTIADPQFLEFVVECFDRTGVAPQQVCFEMSESAVVANLEHARRFVGVLHGIGCEFALDDFGSGVGSFSNLKNLPIDYLKIDGSFTRNLARDSVSRAMVGAMIELARTMHFKVIAEQVEDAAALDAVRQAGFDYVQGYAIGRPQPLKSAA
ncbi:MAG: EAL domain-containing protein [Steroidobacteraceae bacterium]